ncbi:GNAT family N-acetyltransferase [Paraeggerthella sp. Marseille-Q4926]|uniref:GNAT family N-acetyltransferase n=1 Tax=Paraeggerthella sp. Marseille-Q4926 TaxID=2866587 RepID=UPI001CE3FD47|nr:GNAT family N-acetyltransferase [Paraeggerthella sp. Marseille-Q4926]
MLVEELTQRESIVNTWNHLSDAYQPPLSTRLEDFESYVERIAQNGTTFVCKEGGYLAGGIAVYANDTASKTAFVTQLATMPGFRRKGIGTVLIARACDYSKAKGMTSIKLEVRKNNKRAMAFYKSKDFIFDGDNGDTVYLVRSLV